MGVIMTPSDKIGKWPYYWPTLITLGVILLFTVTSLAIHTSGKWREITAPEDTSQKFRQTGPLMTWTGQSELGYTRVEMWKTEGTAYTQEIVIHTSGNENFVTTRVAMVKIPRGLEIGPDMSALFVRVKNDNPVGKVRLE